MFGPPGATLEVENLRPSLAARCGGRGPRKAALIPETARMTFGRRDGQHDENWLQAPAGARRRPEEEGAWRLVDALGLVHAANGGPAQTVIGLLRVWRGSDVVGLDYGTDGDDPTAGLRFVVTPEAMELRLPKVTWDGERPVVGSFLWQRLAWKHLEREGLAELVRQALGTGRSAKKVCTVCGTRVALGRYWLKASRVVCFGCGDGHQA